MQRLFDVTLSAEETGGHVVGPQVVEIAVMDNVLSGTVTPPDVTLNGNAVAMTVAIDGNWYAYVADAGQVAAVYGDSENPGTSFGTTDNYSISGSGASQSYCNTINDDLNVVSSEKALTLTTPNGLSYRPMISHLASRYSTARQAAPKLQHWSSQVMCQAAYLLTGRPILQVPQYISPSTITD